MNGSEGLWSEEELLTQMEEMQDQIEALQEKNARLKKSHATMLDDWRKVQGREQKLSSENCRLRSALQQAERKIQEQSGQIVRLNGSDLILKENEQLRRGIAEAEAAASTVKKEYSAKAQQLNDERKVFDAQKRKLAEMMTDEEKLIEDRARELYEKVIGEVNKKHRAAEAALKKDYRRMIKEFRQRVRRGILFGMIAALMAVVVLLMSNPATRSLIFDEIASLW